MLRRGSEPNQWMLLIGFLLSNLEQRLKKTFCTVDHLFCFLPWNKSGGSAFLNSGNFCKGSQRSQKKKTLRIFLTGSHQFSSQKKNPILIRLVLNRDLSYMTILMFLFIKSKTDLMVSKWVRLLIKLYSGTRLAPESRVDNDIELSVQLPCTDYSQHCS